MPLTTAATAGAGFAVLVVAQDASNNTVNYSGSVTVTSNDPLTPTQGSTALSSGFGGATVTLDTATSSGWTIQVTAGTVTSSSSAVTVAPGAATSFLVSAPASAATGSPLSITIKAQDQFGNMATGYTGTIKFTSTDTAFVSNTYTFTGTGAGHDNGVHSFTGGITLNTPGTQTISALDTTSTNPVIAGTSGAITTRGLVVTALTPNPTGFTATFNKAFLPADLTLYGLNLTTVQDVTMVGAHVGPIHGSLLIDSSNTSFTFKATSSYLLLKNSLAHPATLSALLPDDTYTVKLASGLGNNGIQDSVGEFLDGLNNGGHANYTTTFTTSFQHNATPALGIPDFARGPDGAHAVKVPNTLPSQGGAGGGGIPITLYNAAGVTDVTFTLTYNPALFTVTGALQGINSDATDPNGTFTLGGNSSGVATFTFHDAAPQTGTVILGDIMAVVPNSASNLYQAKEILQIGAIVINQGTVAGAVSSNGIHVNAYFGDVANGDGIIDGLDVLTANKVATGMATGFAAYQLLDPAIVGDVASDLSMDAGDVTALNLFVAQLHPTQIPVPPGFAVVSPNAVDPTLNLVGQDSAPDRAGQERSPDLRNVSINLDDPKPAGSTGLTEVTLALTYDPSVLSLTAADITLGSIPTHGTGWQLTAVVDQATGQIGIKIYSLTPITVADAGSLVNIAFHILPGVKTPKTTVRLVNGVTVNGQYFGTRLADSLGAMILSPGVDQQLLTTGGDDPGNP